MNDEVNENNFFTQMTKGITQNSLWHNVVVSLICGIPLALWGIWASSHQEHVILTTLVSLVLLVVCVLVYLRLFRDRIVVLSGLSDFEAQLDHLAKNHNGAISWITKTSIWAYDLDEFESRLENKVNGIREGRLYRLRYIIHLGYWRTLIKECSEGERRVLLAQYKLRLQNLLKNLRDPRSCPADRVQFVIGETDVVNTPYRFGVYKPKRGAPTVFLVFDEGVPSESNVIPRLMVRSVQMALFFQNMFDRQWNQYRASMLVDEKGKQEEVLRRKVILRLETELSWLENTYMNGSRSLTKEQHER